MEARAKRLASLLRQPPPGFESRLLTIAPGAERRYFEADWRDAIVVVARGQVDLELADGARRRLRSGAVLWLAGLPAAGLRNRGCEPAVLVAARRRAQR